MIEVLVAVSIISIAFVALMFVAQKSVFVANQSLHAAQAVMLLEEGAEVVRIVRDNAWTNISSLSNGTNYYPTYSSTWTLSTTANSIGIFTRKVVFSSVSRDGSSNIVSSGGTVDTSTRLVTVTVTWSEGTRNSSRVLQFYITNIFS